MRNRGERTEAERLHLTNLDVLPEWEHLQAALRHRTLEQTDAAIRRLCALPGISFRAVRWDWEISADVPLQPGDHVSPTTDRAGLRVERSGYLSRHGNQVHVVLPLWVDGEGMTAYFLNLAQKEAPQPPDLTDILGLMQWHGVEYGFTESSLKQVVQALRHGDIRDPLVPIAEGIAPQPGGDADFDWVVTVRFEQSGGGLPASGFTFAEGDGVTLVKKGGLLGRLLPPAEGQPGKDVFGRESKAPTPTNLEVISNARISAEEDENGSMAFYAKADGGIYTASQIRKIRGRTQRRIHLARACSKSRFGSGGFSLRGDGPGVCTQV